MARSRKRPRTTLPPSAASSCGSAASTEMPPVSAASMKRLRRMVAAETSVTAAAESTLGRLRTDLTAASGSCALAPRNVWPGATVSRLVPSSLSSATSPALLDSEIPSTATIAAMPIATPSADSAARRRRVRRPTLATRTTSPASRRLRGIARSARSRRRVPLPGTPPPAIAREPGPIGCAPLTPRALTEPPGGARRAARRGPCGRRGSPRAAVAWRRSRGRG